MQPHIWQLLVVTIAGWVNRYQQDAIDYLKEENRILREHVGGRRLRFTDEQRRVSRGRRRRRRSAVTNLCFKFIVVPCALSRRRSRSQSSGETILSVSAA